MLTKSEAVDIAVDKMIELFGKEYLRKNFSEILNAECMMEDKNIFQLFWGIKDSDEYPKEEASYDGWVVYATVNVDLETGAVTVKDFAFPEACRE